MTILFIVVKSRAPKSNFLDWYTGKNIEFDKSQLPIYARFVVGTLILSILLGYVIVPNTSSVIWFTALNVGVMAVTGVNLVLYKPRKNVKDTQEYKDK